MSRPILQLENVSRNFRGEFHIRNINLTLYKGEVHVIIGENGSGKSALMKIICGLLEKDSGSIYYYGKPVSFSSLHEAKSQGVVYQHQDVQMFDNLSVAENIFFDRLPSKKFIVRGIDRLQVESDCSKLFAKLRIPIDPAASMSRLGYAQRQLAAAAKCYVSDARIVIFDEPTASMSEVERNIFFELLEKIKQKVEGIFYISHRMDEITRVGDRVSVLYQGSVIGTEKKKNINPISLIQMMIGDPHQERYPKIDIEKGHTVLSVEHIKYGHILRDVNFQLQKSEILGITGLMGSGRTCLANCLFGLLVPDVGKIFIEGTQVQLKHPNDAMGHGISLIPENREQNAIFPFQDLSSNMTVASLHRFARSKILDQRCMQQVVHDYVQRLGISPGNKNDIIKTYSGGNKQRVMIGRWFMRRSKIYIMDEPTRGIDVAAKVDVYNAMNNLVANGASVILISSEIEEILGMCDRVIVLSGGREVCNLPKGSATKQNILHYATSRE